MAQAALSELGSGLVSGSGFGFGFGFGSSVGSSVGSHLGFGSGFNFGIGLPSESLTSVTVTSLMCWMPGERRNASKTTAEQ